MRPRKKILLLARSVSDLQEWGFLLQNWGFAPIPATSRKGVATQLERNPDCCVAMVPVEDLVVQAALANHGELKLLAYGDGRRMTQKMADRCVYEGPAYQARMLDALKTLAARKRGPKLRCVEEQEAVAA